MLGSGISVQTAQCDMGQRFRHAVRRIDRRGKSAHFRLQTVVHRSAADNQNIRLLQPLLFFGNTERVINLQRNHRRKSQRLFYIRKRMAGSRTHYQIQPRNQRTHHHHHSPYITKVHTQQSGISRLQVQKLASEAGALHHPVFAHHQFFRRACGARRMDGDNRRGIEPLLQKKIQIPQGGRAVFRSSATNRDISPAAYSFPCSSKRCRCRSNIIGYL